jgi:hypothetical protein
MLRGLAVLAVSLGALTVPSQAAADAWTWDAATGDLVGELDSVSTDANPLASRAMPRFPQMLRTITCTPQCPPDSAQVRRLVLRAQRHIELEGAIDAATWGGSQPQLVLELGYGDDRALASKLLLPWRAGSAARIIAKDGSLYLGGEETSDIEVHSTAWMLESTGTVVADNVDFSGADANASLAFNGGAGNDVIRAGAKGGSLSGGLGDDVLIGSRLAPNSLMGDYGNDRLIGGAAADRLDSGSGNDVMIGAAGNDTIIGGLGADTANGGAGRDRIELGAGNDRAIGGPGNDFFFDFLGVNTVIAGPGNDRIMNGLVIGRYAVFAKRSIINCGAGRDTISDAYPKRQWCERILRRRR